MAMKPEAKVKMQVKKWLKDRGIFFYMPVQSGFGVVGIPDFVCCAQGRFLGIETKAPGERSNTTPNQDRVLSEIKVSGGIAVVVDDVTQLEGLLDE